MRKRKPYKPTGSLVPFEGDSSFAGKLHVCMDAHLSELFAACADNTKNI